MNIKQWFSNLGQLQKRLVVMLSITTGFFIALGGFYFGIEVYKSINTQSNNIVIDSEVSSSLKEDTTIKEPQEEVKKEDITFSIYVTDVEFAIGKGYPIQLEVTGTDEKPTITVTDNSLVEIVELNSREYFINSKEKTGTGTVTFKIADIECAVNFTVKDKNTTTNNNTTNNNQSSNNNAPYDGQTKVENGITYEYFYPFGWTEVQTGGGNLGNLEGGGTGEQVMQ